MTYSRANSAPWPLGIYRSLGPHEHRLSRSGLVHSCVTPSCHSVSNHPLNLHDRVWSRCAHECSSKVETGFAVTARARRYQKAESSLLALRTDVSPLVAPHPASRRRSYLWLQTMDLSSEEDLHLSDFTHFEPHIGVGRVSPPPPSEPYGRISRIRLSSWWFYLNED